MTKALALIAAPVILAAATLAAPTIATADDDRLCGNIPLEQWLAPGAIKEKATALGFTVRKVDIDDGCYEVDATDKNGAKVELRLNPATGALVRQKLDD
jgi:hypothetical protein